MSTFYKPNEEKYLESKLIFDDQTGKASARLTYKRKPLYSVPLTGRIPSQIAGYSLINKDLKNARQWAYTAISMTNAAHSHAQVTKGNYFLSQDREQFDMIKALFIASLTFYAKAFTKCEARNAKLARKDLSNDFREDHDFYMNLRNKYVAHSGSEDLESAQPHMLLSPKKNSKFVPRMHIIRSQPDVAISEDEATSFVALIDHVISLVDTKVIKASEKLFEEHIATHSIEFWRTAGKKKISVECG
ncbi:TPA: hypothetical protein ACPHRY_004578 [Vibrio antiquarius]|uniref:hypothetical protein n=1 Tax=Vibrio antiquarius (strain Ex25) TaxID=150340 RepID=UPI0009415194|nr:hypothetical protein [Vibrio antiquarius]OKQ17088.1 hypothetical protein H058_19265 [Vibrio antiquarius]